MILVTGVTGTTGGAALRALLERDAPVRVLVRDPARFDAPEGVEVAVGEFADPAALASALQGVQGAYLVHPGTPAEVAAESAFISAAQRAGLPHLVLLSVVGADHPGIDAIRFGAAHRAVEAVASASGIPTTFLRPNGFLQNYLGQAASIREQGVFYSPLSPAAVVSHVDAEDIGAVAATVLTEPGHEGAAYTLTGPEALSDDDIPGRLSPAPGREAAHVQVTPEDARASMVSMGYPEWVADGIMELSAFYETGGAAAVAADIERLLGRPARSVDDFAAAHREAFGGKAA